MAGPHTLPDFRSNSLPKEEADECPSIQPDLYILELQFGHSFTYNYRSRSFSLRSLLQSASIDITPVDEDAGRTSWDDQGDDADLTGTHSLLSQRIWKTRHGKKHSWRFFTSI